MKNILQMKYTLDKINRGLDVSEETLERRNGE